jgi:hypothetical protein
MEILKCTISKIYINTTHNEIALPYVRFYVPFRLKHRTRCVHSSRGSYRRVQPSNLNKRPPSTLLRNMTERSHKAKRAKYFLGNDRVWRKRRISKQSHSVEFCSLADSFVALPPKEKDTWSKHPKDPWATAKITYA